MKNKSIALVLVLLVLINSTGCFSYQKLEIENERGVEVEGKVKITTRNDIVYYFYDVEVLESSVKGKQKTPTNQIKVIVLDVEDIKKIEREEFQAGLTVAVFIIVPAILIILMLLSMDK